MKVTIERGRWIRPPDTGSRLHRIGPDPDAERQHDAAGFACAAAGIPIGLLTGRHHVRQLPAHVLGSAPEPIRRMTRPEYVGTEGFTRNSAAATELYQVNDDPTIGDTERERRITEIGRRIGIDFTFTGTGRPRPRVRPAPKGGWLTWLRG